MSSEKTETITIRLPAELKRQVETAAQMEKRSTSSFIEVALEKFLKSSGYIENNVPQNIRHNVRGRWLTIRPSQSPFPGKGFPNLWIESPNEPGFIFGARDMDSVVSTAESAFDGIDYGRRNPNSVDYSPTKKD